MDANRPTRPYRRSGLYLRAAKELTARDRRVERLARRLHDAMPWLTVADRPAMKAWAQLELLADVAYSILHKDGILNAKGEPRRLVTDFRQLRQVQLQYMAALGLTPASRASIKADGRHPQTDLVTLLASAAHETDEKAAQGNGDGAQSVDPDTTDEPAEGGIEPRK
jgi:hypothetical protein